MSRKRDQDPEDEDDYGEEELSDEERTTKRPKKKKPKFGGFLDMEAEEDDDGDDDDDDQQIAGLYAEDDGDAEAEDDRQQARAQRLQRKQAIDDDDPNAYIDYINRKFGDDDDDADQGPPDTSGIDQQSLLPTIRDPRLYIARCRKPGHERRAILTLLQKYYDFHKKGRDLGIVSAVAPEHLKGRIYIEATSAAQVDYAISGLDLFASYESVKALRLEEMTDVLKVGKKLDRQVPGNWVRRTRGMYKGDLAQVVRVEGNENYVTIRLIPRPDIKGERAIMKSNDNEYEDDTQDSTSDLVLNTKRRGRPPQKLFDKNEVSRLSGSTDVFTQRSTVTGEMFDYWNNESYRHGLLYSRVSIKLLIVGDNVNPTVEELEMWLAAEAKMRLAYEEDDTIMSREEAAEGLNLKLSSGNSSKKTGLFKGDSVNITKGEQKGLRGTVAGFEGDVVLMQTAEFPEPLRVSRAHLTKTFKMADHVSVVVGKYVGQSGVIVHVTNNFLTIFTDSTQEHIRVQSSHVADSNDVDTSIATAGQSAMNGVSYEIFDLVQLQSDINAVGVVVRVKADGIDILTPQNQLQTVPIREIKNKIMDKSARAMDARNNPIAMNDTIRVISGPAKDRNGVVQHVAGPTVFFKARDELKNCGIIAVPANSCTANTATARRLSLSNSMHKGPAPIPRGSIASLGMGGGGRGQGGRGGMGGGPRSRDPLMRKDVKIIQGQWKGYMGKVVYCDDRNVRVELASKMKTISIAKSKVRDLESNDDSVPQSNGSRPISRLSGGLGSGGYNSGGSYGAGGYGGGRPPTHYNGNRTPRPDNFMQTPRQTTDRFNAPGSRTPAPNYGVSTPHRNGFSSMTPRVTQHQTPRSGFGRMGTPAASDSFRPSTPGVATDYDRAPYAPPSFGSGMSAPSHVGSANAYGRTAIPHTPATPGDGLSAMTPAPMTPAPSYSGIVEPRTPANILEPRTPGPVGNEPRTPAPAMEPATPAPMMEPRTPAPNAEPATPMMHPMEPATPMMAEPPTPHTPAMVPHTPAPAGEQGEPDQVGYKVLIDVMVSVINEDNNTGVVLDASFNGSFVLVRMVSGPRTGQNISLTGDDITPVQPQSEINPDKLEMVKVLDGKHQGRMGRVAAVRNVDGEAIGRIRFDNGEEELSLPLMAKCHDPDDDA